MMELFVVMMKLQEVDKAKKLKVISKWGTGIDSIDIEYLKKKRLNFLIPQVPSQRLLLNMH